SPSKLSHFIAYTLHHNKIHSSVTFVALVLLQRLTLKACLPTARGSWGHRFFVSAQPNFSQLVLRPQYDTLTCLILHLRAVFVVARGRGHPKFHSRWGQILIVPPAHAPTI
ncbi:hypothetical protein DFJ58DRAFT_657169, partial [Suillus subalutaceus]|uniref:uncharacterized protein n=1 Tax=Suillus subalutaceus TaxID=48586 RepID=UPI001B860382